MPDTTDTLLAEIRDLLKEHHRSAVEYQKAMMHDRKIARAAGWAKAILYAGIVLFTMYATYFYYSSIVSLTSPK